MKPSTEPSSWTRAIPRVPSKQVYLNTYQRRNGAPHQRFACDRGQCRRQPGHHGNHAKRLCNSYRPTLVSIKPVFRTWQCHRRVPRVALAAGEYATRACNPIFLSDRHNSTVDRGYAATREQAMVRGRAPLGVESGPTSLAGSLT